MVVSLLLLVSGLAAQAQTAKRYITLEHFTNTRCSNCAAGNPTLFSTLDNNPGEVHHLSIHSRVPYTACVFYQHNTTGNDFRRDLYNITGTPSTLTNGTVKGVGASNLLPQTRIDTLKDRTSPLRIKVSQSMSGGNLNVTVSVRSFRAMSNPNLLLFVAIAEREVAYSAPNGEPLHHNVFRKMLPGDGGAAFSPAAVGQAVVQTFSAALHPDWDTNQVYAYVFIQDTATLEIVNSGTPFDLIPEPAVVPEDCANAANGSINLVVTGGTPPYNYTWSNGVLSSTNPGLAAGTYVVTITDAENFRYVDSVTVPQLNSLQSVMSYTPSTMTNGTATVVAAGGTPPYQYLWANGDTGATADSLAVGFAPVTITDANGCQRQDSIYVSAFMVQASLTDASCFGASDGSIKVTVTGGIPPFSYSWSVAGAGDSIGGLAAGNYGLTILDSNNNPFEGSYTVAQPTDISLTVTTTATEAGASSGSALVEASGGTPPYTYAWSSGASTAEATQLGFDVYSVTVTDGQNCQQTATASIQEVITGLAPAPASQPLKLYPNPFGSRLNLTLPPATGSTSLAVYNLLGERVYQYNTTGLFELEINTSRWDNGIYLLELTSTGRRQTQRVVKAQ